MMCIVISIHFQKQHHLSRRIQTNIQSSWTGRLRRLPEHRASGNKGMAAIELLKEVGYDALTVGNNEMFNGPGTLQHMAGNSPVPFISNNLYLKDQSEING